MGLKFRKFFEFAFDGDLEMFAAIKRVLFLGLNFVFNVERNLFFLSNINFLRCIHKIHIHPCIMDTLKFSEFIECSSVR